MIYMVILVCTRIVHFGRPVFVYTHCLPEMFAPSPKIEAADCIYAQIHIHLRERKRERERERETERERERERLIREI